MGSSINLQNIGTRLTADDAREHQETVADLLKRNRLAFPGAQPVSFTREHLTQLERKDFLMCEKTDGIRCLLYLHHFVPADGPPLEMQFLIDRKNDYYFIARDTLHLPLEGDLGGCHTGTILDGELVVEEYPDERGKQIHYLIFDCLCLDGVTLTERSYDIRLGKVQKFVYEPWRKFAEKFQDDARAQPFQLRLKKMELPYGTEMMFRETIPKLRHGNDGLIFTCKATPYQFGTDRNILKWKPPQENTIDFRIELGDFPMLEDENGQYPDWDAKPNIGLVIGGKSNTQFAKLALTDEEWETLKSMNRRLDGSIIECYRDALTGQWRPKLEERDHTPRFRDDKTEPNHVSTVQSVIESIEDAVTEEDLISHAGKIKEEWKNRERARQEAARAEQERRKAMERKHSDAEKRVRAEADDGPGYSDD